MDLLSIWSVPGPQKPHLLLLLWRAAEFFPLLWHQLELQIHASVLIQLPSLSFSPVRGVSHLHPNPFSLCSKGGGMEALHVNKGRQILTESRRRGKDLLVRDMGLGCCMRLEDVSYVLGEDQRSQKHRWWISKRSWLTRYSLLMSDCKAMDH